MHSKRSQLLIYFILSCMKTCMNRQSLKKQLVEGPVTYGFTLNLRVCDHTTRFWRCAGMAFGHFLLGSHNVMVMALGSCVKWPLLMMICLNLETWMWFVISLFKSDKPWLVSYLSPKHNKSTNVFLKPTHVPFLVLYELMGINETAILGFRVYIGSGLKKLGVPKKQL